MKRIAYFLLLSLSCSVGFTQSDISYEVKDENVEFNEITIAPFMGVNYSFGQTFSTNVGLELMVRKLPIHLRAYIDQTIISAALFTAGYSGPRIIEGGASYPFIEKTAEKTRRLNLKVSSTESGGYEYTSSTYIMVPTNVFKYTSARAGIFRNKGNYNQSLSFIGQPTPYDVNADYTVTGLYTGISQTWQKNTIYEVKDWGQRRNTSWLELYADVLIGLAKNFGVFDSPFIGFQGIQPITNSQVSYSNLGARVGLMRQFNNYSGRRANGGGAKMEFGVRPAPTGERLWMNFQAFYLFNVK